jgi:hypothetical protein
LISDEHCGGRIVGYGGSSVSAICAKPGCAKIVAANPTARA